MVNYLISCYSFSSYLLLFAIHLTLACCARGGASIGIKKWKHIDARELVMTSAYVCPNTFWGRVDSATVGTGSQDMKLGFDVAKR